MSVVVRSTPRTDADIMAEFEEPGVATVHEAQGRGGLLEPWLRPVFRPPHIAGTALTCEAGLKAEDSAKVYEHNVSRVYPRLGAALIASGR
jgi:regulator of RNase E activity RraA